VHIQKETTDTEPLELATKAHQRYLLKASIDDLNDAINYYIMAIKQHPEVSETYYRLASLLHENGQIGLHAAIEQCQQAVKLDPKNASAHMYLGYFLALDNEVESAKEHFKLAIKLKPLSSARTRMVLALTMFENNKDLKSFSEGLYYLLSGSALFLADKTSIKVLFKNIGNNLGSVGLRVRGTILEKLNKDIKAYELYKDALDNSKNSVELYSRMARIAVKNKRHEVALECYQSAIKVSNGTPETLINAIEFLKEYYPNNIDEQLDYYNALITLNPAFSRCYYDMGHLYLKKEDKINALNAFKLALENDEGNPYYQNSLAFAYVQLEQYDEAVELYKQALQTNPDDEWTALIAQALAAIYHQVKGNTQAALSMLQNALLLTKNKSQIHLAIADIHYDLDDLDIAIKHYEIALKGNNENSRAHSRLGMAFWEKDEIEKSIIHYSKAIDLDPEYDIAYNNLGVIFIDGLEDANRALTYFETAIDISPNYVLAHFNAARAHEMLGEKLEAANKYQMALDLNQIKPEIENELIEERLFGLFDT